MAFPKKQVETMDDGLDAAPYTKRGEAGDNVDPAAEHTDDHNESGNAVYDMFCELSPEEKSRVLKMCQEHVNGAQKKPMKPSDDREFTPMDQEDK